MVQVEGAALPLPQGMFSRASSHDLERTCSRRQMHVEGSSLSVLIVSFRPMTLVGFPWVVGDRPMKLSAFSEVVIVASWRRVQPIEAAYCSLQCEYSSCN